MPWGKAPTWSAAEDAISDLEEAYETEQQQRHYLATAIVAYLDEGGRLAEAADQAQLSMRSAHALLQEQYPDPSDRTGRDQPPGGMDIMMRADEHEQAISATNAALIEAERLGAPLARLSKIVECSPTQTRRRLGQI